MIRGAIRLAIVGAGISLRPRPDPGRAVEAAPSPTPISSLDRHRRADRARLGGPRRHRGPAALDARDEGDPDARRPGRSASARAARPTSGCSASRVTDPVDDHRVRAAAPLRHQPRRHVQGPRPDHPRIGRRRDDHHRPLGRGPRSPPVFPHLGALVDGAGARAIFQADLGRFKELVETGSVRPTDGADRAAPPGRRDLRAVPRALRAAAAGPRARRHPAVGRVRAVRPAAVPAARGGRDPRRLRHGPGDRVVPQRPLSRATSRRPGCRRSCSPSSPSPRPRSRRSGSSSGRWSSSRPTTPSARPPSGSREDPGVERILVCTPDKDMAQLVLDDRVVLWDRRRGIVYDDAGVRAKWGVAADLDPGLARPRRRFVGRLPGPARLGREVRRRRPRRLRPLEDIPPQGVRPGRCRASAARARWPSPRPCATTGTRRCSTATWPACGPSTDGVPIRQHDPDELRWDGAPRAEWEAFCEEWGLDRLRSRPHRWLREG